MTTMLTVLLVALVGSQCAAAKDLLETLTADSTMSKLVSLVTEAGLVGELQSGNFTIFAPTNAAFAKVPAASLDSLNTTALAYLLHYHVIAGKVMKSDVSNEQTVPTLAGTKLRVNIYPHNNVVTVEGVPIETFDVAASNGYIHKLDSVMIPPSGNVVHTVRSFSHLSTLLAAVTKAGLVDALLADHLTLFAPTNEAFAKIDSGDLNKILNNSLILTEVLTYHVVNHTMYSAGLYDHEVRHSIDTHHDRLRISVSSTGVKINNVATVTTADISATNGVVHVIDHVLIPGPVLTWLRTGVIG